MVNASSGPDNPATDPPAPSPPRMHPPRRSIIARRALALALALAGIGTVLCFLQVSPLVVLAIVCLGVGASLVAAALARP